MDLIPDFADLLEAAGRKLNEPPGEIPPAAYAQLIKDAILNLAKGGIEALQMALGVTADGIIGPITRKALADIEVTTLLAKLSVPIVSGTDLSFATLSVEYGRLFSSMQVNSSRINTVNTIVSHIKSNFQRYDNIALQTSVSPNIIGIIHSLEADLSFGRHFHNGDLLSRRTVNVPMGRPTMGNPPFTWEESVLDAIMFYNLDKWQDWSLEGIAYTLERYNGWGYRLYHPRVKSPYLWSFTNVYTSGKYDVDGHFDSALVSEQCGGMALLKGLLS